MKLYRTSDNTEVLPGTILTDFRGDKWKYLKISRAPTERSTGRIAVDDGKGRRDFYPSVFSCFIK